MAADRRSYPSIEVFTQCNVYPESISLVTGVSVYIYIKVAAGCGASSKSKADSANIKMVIVLGLNREQSVYFENLVFFNQARSIDGKTFYYEKLLRASAKSSFRKLETTQLQIFRRWYAIAIREMLSLKDFRNKPAWITDRLLPWVEQYEAQESLPSTSPGSWIGEISKAISEGGNP